MFVASKLFWMVADPGNLLILLIWIGTILLFTRWRRAGRRLIAVTAGAAFIIVVLPVGGWLLIPLENRFPPMRNLPQQVDGIVVLGGAVDQLVTAARGQPALTGGAERMTEAVALARRYPKARLIFTGGSGLLNYPDLKETRVAAMFFASMGIPKDRLELEDQSRNTYDNAVMTLKLAAPKPGERWLLITSAMHMPRAYGCFRAAGWHITPYPVDFTTRGFATFEPHFHFIGSLSGLRRAMHEWIGLVAYRLLGRTDALFPGPDAALNREG